MNIGLMRESSLPENGYELYFDERPGMVRVRFFENLGPAETMEGEEQDDSIRFRYYDTWEYEIEGVEAYVRDNSAWLLEMAKEEARLFQRRLLAEQAQKELDATDYKTIKLMEKVLVEQGLMESRDPLRELVRDGR